MYERPLYRLEQHDIFWVNYPYKKGPKLCRNENNYLATTQNIIATTQNMAAPSAQKSIHYSFF